ncbi:hypothetical protein L596_013967 [Steinernema carpocapsae]|uniref:Uncharacterized protein n=1 Tax=Steinernema carpocapsae TaxID=34508 RepID=A0A4U5NB77_STECR|nr:hypothetical protein L596_013967 [Steinernema carpocapsae]
MADSLSIVRCVEKRFVTDQIGTSWPHFGHQTHEAYIWCFRKLTPGSAPPLFSPLILTFLAIQSLTLAPKSNPYLLPYQARFQATVSNRTRNVSPNQSRLPAAI